MATISAIDTGQTCQIDVAFYRLSEAIAPYFTSLSCFTLRRPATDLAIDVMHPEWATMRFVQTGDVPCSGFDQANLSPRTVFLANGPTSQAVHFSLGKVRIWGLGLQPLGWAVYGDVPACDIAESIVDGASEPAFARFRGLPGLIHSCDTDKDKTACRIDDYLMGLRQDHTPAREHIIACHSALCNPEVANVDMLAEATGMNRRTLERACLRYFGYPPKLLLRRQRFLRSLARFMSADRENWSSAIDRRYYDQAHFVRDFRQFMSMTPSEYAQMPHPVMDRVIAQRMAELGAAPQTDSKICLSDAMEVQPCDDPLNN